MRVYDRDAIFRRSSRVSPRLSCNGRQCQHSLNRRDSVAIVINDATADSQRIGEHYARTRLLPASNVFRIRVSPDETVERGVYLSSIEVPIAAAIRRA